MGTSVDFPTVVDRVLQAEKVVPLGGKSKLSDSDTECVSWYSVLKGTFGIEDNEEGLSLLNAHTTTEEFIYNELLSCVSTKDKPKLKLKAVASILKGIDPFSKKDIDVLSLQDFVGTQKDKDINNLITVLRTPDKMKDRELLEAFDSDREHDIEQELLRRSKGQAFIVLLDGSTEDKSKIDIDVSLELLKRSRKMTNPTIIPHPNDPGKIVQVYQIGQLHMEDNIVELCPFCDEVMFKGYCQKCNANFAGVGDEERSYVRLISESDGFKEESFSDRRSVLVSALKGLESLREVWPSVSIRFRELKMLGDLPKLRKIRKLPSARPADPFNVRSK